MSVYKFENERCEICSAHATISVNVGQEEVREVYEWDESIRDWAVLADYAFPVVFYHFLCANCYEGLSRQIERGEWPKYD